MKPPSVFPSIEVRCASCRKAKRAAAPTYSVCKHREGGMFTIFGDKPCELWTPSVRCIRLLLQRHGEKTARFEAELKREVADV